MSLPLAATIHSRLPIPVAMSVPPASTGAPPRPALDRLADTGAKRARILFSSSVSAGPSAEEGALRAQLGSKIGSEWAWAAQLPPALLAQQSGANERKRKAPSSDAASASSAGPSPSTSGALVAAPTAPASDALVAFRTEEKLASSSGSRLSTALVRKKELEARQDQPAFHPDWRLMRVLSGHNGWVRAVAVEPNNQWFATGSADQMIKIWDLASGELKLSLTGHKSTVRGLAVSSRHPYLFSAGEDKEVKCWDLETNKVIRKYTGHKSGIYSLALHPTLDVLVSGGRDSVARVWDMRTRSEIHVLRGHTHAVTSVVCQEADPQVITGSVDQTVRLWDLAAGKTFKTLTQHHKSVRALALHPTRFSFASGSAMGSNIKTWRCPEGTLLTSQAHGAIVNTLACNADGVLFAGGDNGLLKFYDYDTGVPFQTTDDVPQPGSLDAEAGVFCSTFDHSGTRLITGGADKTIKVYREVA